MLAWNCLSMCTVLLPFKKNFFNLMCFLIHTCKPLHHWKYYLSFVLDQRSSLYISPCLVSHLEIQNNCNCANSNSYFRVCALCSCWKERYLHDKFLVIAVDEVEDVEINSSAEVIWILRKFVILQKNNLKFHGHAVYKVKNWPMFDMKQCLLPASTNSVSSPLLANDWNKQGKSNKEDWGMTRLLKKG